MARNGIKCLRADIFVPIMTINPLILLQKSPPQ